MAEINLSTDELLVLGGPSEVQLSVDFGEKGDRGSIIYASAGDPNIALINQDPQPYDLCINILTTDTNYSYVYQYMASVTGTTYNWEPIIKFNPNVYFKNISGSFDGGSKLFNIPLVSIVDLDTAATLTNANFSVQATIQNSNPTASSVSLGSLVTVEDVYVLPITVHAAEFSGGTWVDLEGTKIVQFCISIVV